MSQVKLSTHLQRIIVLAVVLSIGVAGCSPAPSSPAPVVTVPQATFTPAPATPTTVPPTAVPATATSEATAVPPTATTEPTPLPPAQVTATDLVNVRSGPGTNYQPLGQLTAGQTVEATGRNAEGTWWQIAYADGPEGKGWVLGQFVTANDQTERLPVVTPAAAPTQPPAPPAPTKPPAPPPAATATQPPSMAYAAPSLITPADGTIFTGQAITIWLNWSSVGALRSGDCYKLRIKHKDGNYDSECIYETAWLVQEWLFQYRPDNRTLQWSVRVVDANNNQVSPWSQTWNLVWYGG